MDAFSLRCQLIWCLKKSLCENFIEGEIAMFDIRGINSDGLRTRETAQVLTKVIPRKVEESIIQAMKQSNSKYFVVPRVSCLSQGLSGYPGMSSTRCSASNPKQREKESPSLRPSLLSVIGCVMISPIIEDSYKHLISSSNPATLRNRVLSASVVLLKYSVGIPQNWRAQKLFWKRSGETP